MSASDDERPPVATKKRTRVRSQYPHWCWTIYDPMWAYDGADENIRYLVAQEEKCPDTGRIHWQGYAEFYTKVTRAVAQRSIHPSDPTFHIENRGGSREQARDYCMGYEDNKIEPKERHEDALYDGPQEFGIWICGPGGRTDLRRVVHEQTNGMSIRDIAINYGDTYIRNFRGISMRDMHIRPKPPRQRPMQVHVRWGPPSSGKTHPFMVEADPEPYEKDLDTEFWTDYNGETSILLEDFTGQINITRMLRICDKYKLSVDTKHGAPVAAKWTTVYITSNVHPMDWYPRASLWQRQAVVSRLTTVTYCGALRNRATGVLTGVVIPEPVRVPEMVPVPEVGGVILGVP